MPPRASALIASTRSCLRNARTKTTPRTIVAFNTGVKVRIVRRPTGTLDGMALKSYVPGEVYDLSPSLADYLVLLGYAKPEMRSPARVTVKKKHDRRR